MDRYILTIEKGGYNLTEQPELGIVQYTIDDSELDYLLDQIRHNLPFILAIDDTIIAISPSQCISIKIEKEEKENEFKN